MSDSDNLTESFESSPEESAVIAALRKENRDQAKKLSAFEAAAAEAEAAAQTQRAETAKGLMNNLGLPGLADDVLDWIEGDITAEAVTAVLEAKSIPLPEGSVQPTPESIEQTPNPSDVGQRVADVAGGVDKRSLDELLAEATSNDEINAIMAEAGLTSNHS